MQKLLDLLNYIFSVGEAYSESKVSSRFFTKNFIKEREEINKELIHWVILFSVVLSTIICDSIFSFSYLICIPFYMLVLGLSYPIAKKYGIIK